MNHVPVPVDLPLDQRLAAAVKLYGESQVIERSLNIIDGQNEGADFLLFVGGEHANGLLNGAPVLYWPELWGLRALLYAWDDSAAPAVIRALADTAWRVREMAARVVAARELSAAVELREMLEDSVPRVRVAAAKSLSVVGEAEDMDRIRPLLKDPEMDVRRGARQAIDALRARLRND